MNVFGCVFEATEILRQISLGISLGRPDLYRAASSWPMGAKKETFTAFSFSAAQQLARPLALVTAKAMLRNSEWRKNRVMNSA
jgi:hypothetical protein